MSAKKEVEPEIPAKTYQHVPPGKQPSQPRQVTLVTAKGQASARGSRYWKLVR